MPGLAGRDLAGAQDAGLVIETDHMVWTNGFFMGDYAAAIDSAEHARRLYRAEAHHGLTYRYSGHDPGVCCRCFAGMASWQKGRLEHGMAQCREAVELAEQLSHPLTTAIAYWGMSYLHMFRSEPEEALAWAQREIEICRRLCAAADPVAGALPGGLGDGALRRAPRGDRAP